MSNNILNIKQNSSICL